MSFNVLIVDDSIIIRKMVAKTLSISDLDIGEYYFAANGKQALEYLEDQWIDIVFADINMPVMNGMEMLDEMANRDILSTIPVVIISTERSEPRMKELKEKGIQAYLQKPFMPERFTEVVTSILTPGKG
ncbi:MAG TPA: response regulator [Desulfohalobiaceae bacterium]|nr:response regulator [Desulfohalobiaceae bacterium]